MHRLRYAARTKSFARPLAGEVEVDESMFGGKESNKPLRKRNSKNVNTVGKTVVFGLVERNGDAPWFTIKQLSDIFGRDVNTVTDHVQGFIDDGELDEATTRKFRVVQNEGGREVSREINHFSLDVAFYVGYRVNSAQGVMFRKRTTRSFA